MQALSQFTVSRRTLISAAAALFAGLSLGIAGYALYKEKPPPTAVESVADKLAVVNGKPVPAAQAAPLIKQFRDQGQPDTPELRALVRRQIIDREILTQEAEKRQLTSSVEFRNQMEFARQTLAMQAVLQDVLKNNPASDDEVKSEYEKLKAQTGDREYHVRHILVEKEEDAKAIIAKLLQGAKFESLAKLSMDAATAAKGGDIGWMLSSAFVQPVVTALASLSPGQYTIAPVKTERGYHVIKLEGIRPTTFLPFDQAKTRIADMVQQKKLETFQEELRKKAQVQ
jgi:peptidyl-prolyl cis-trans isomerase C